MNRKLYGTTRRYRRNIRRSAIWLRNYIAWAGFDEWDIHPRGRVGQCKHGASHATWLSTDDPLAALPIWRCDYCNAITRMSITGTRSETVIEMRSYRDGFGHPLNGGRLVTTGVFVPSVHGASYENGSYLRNAE